MWKIVIVCLVVISIAACTAIKQRPRAVVISVAKGVHATVQSMKEIKEKERNCGCK